ncbi:MAG: RDD family protein [Planctomycetota bacterium]
MKFQIKCKDCGKKLEVSLAHAGKRGKCAGCASIIEIPSAEALQAAAAKQSSPPDQDPFSAPADDLGGDLFGGGSGSAFDEDDFNFPGPQSAAPAEQNPFASPVAGGQPTYPSTASQTGAYAGFGARFAASLLDGLILFALLFCTFMGVSIVLGFVLAGSIDPNDPEPSVGVILGIQLVVFSVLIGVQWLYYALQHSSASQATIGKRALGIKVTDMRGQRISFGRASGRFFAMTFLSGILLIGYIMAAFTEKKQALHDILAGTLVVQS